MYIKEQIELIELKLKKLDKLGHKKPHTKYTLADGTVVPSTTTIIGGNLGWNKFILQRWIRSMARKGKDSDAYTEVSARIGTLAHYFAEQYIKGEPIDKEYVADEFIIEEVAIAKTAFEGFKKWAKEAAPKLIHSEVQLVCETHVYGGTIDLIIELNGELHIFDIKTSNHVHDEMILQLAAYRNLYESNYNEKIKNATIIKISKESPDYELFPVTSEKLDKGWEVFKALLKVNKMHSEIKF
jgi:ATP-dependent exoDNAse (exonuclease V) beta subunit